MRIFESYFKLERGWFRIFGYGLCWKDTSKHDLLFSERNGYKKFLRIGKYVVSFLSKDKLLYNPNIARKQYNKLMKYKRKWKTIDEITYKQRNYNDFLRKYPIPSEDIFKYPDTSKYFAGIDPISSENSSVGFYEWKY